MNNSMCLWNDDISIYLFPNINYISKNSITVGSLISLSINNTIGSYSFPPISKPSVTSTILVQRSEYLQYPTVIISSSTFIDPCTPFMLDFSNSNGHGGREWGKIAIEVIDSQTRNVFKIQYCSFSSQWLTKPNKIGMAFRLAMMGKELFEL